MVMVALIASSMMALVLFVEVMAVLGAILTLLRVTLVAGDL
jgi:hypothetical protein